MIKSRELLACTRSYFGRTGCRKTSATEIPTFKKYFKKSQNCSEMTYAVIGWNTMLWLVEIFENVGACVFRHDDNLNGWSENSCLENNWGGMMNCLAHSRYRWIIMLEKCVHSDLKWIIGAHGNWKNQNPGGCFRATW